MSLVIELEKSLGTVPQGWEYASIASLDQKRIAPQGATIVNAVPQVDTATFLRALAITVIVSSHLGFLNYPGGAAYALLIIAGTNFAMFQIRGLAHSGLFLAIGRLLGRVMFPTMAYVLLNSATIASFDYRVLLLHSNWYDPHLGQDSAYWFVEVYVQIVLLLGLMFALPSVRRAFSLNPFRASMLLFALSIGLLISSELVWDTNHLYRRLPHLVLWLFSAGIAAHFAERTSQKLLVGGAFLGGAAFHFQSEVFLNFSTYALMLLILRTSISVPSWSMRPISSIAGASLFIYLTHCHTGTMCLSIGVTEPLLSVVASILIGVILWQTYNSLMKLGAHVLQGRFLAGYPSLQRRSVGAAVVTRATKYSS